MLTLIFAIMMIVVLGKLTIWGIKAAWGITKMIVTVVLFPLVLICIACAGAMYLAMGLLLIGGIVTFVGAAMA